MKSVCRRKMEGAAGKMLSVIIPLYNEMGLISEMRDAVDKVLSLNRIPYEIIFVNDGSADHSWEMIEREADRHSQVKGISFSRNFGKEAAVFAGLTEAGGDCCVVMDCDFQHPPEKIPEMYELWEQGFEIIEGRKRNNSSSNLVYSMSAKLFYMLISRAAGWKMDGSSDFKLLDRKAVDAVLQMPERNSFFRAASRWIGFETAVIEYDVQPRKKGYTKWKACALAGYALSNIAAFTDAPMQIVTILGAVMLAGGFLLGAMSLYQWGKGEAVEGFTTVIIMQCFTGSITMISIGIVGFYIAKIYDEIKRRPRYIISEKTECGDKTDAKIKTAEKRLL